MGIIEILIPCKGMGNTKHANGGGSTIRAVQRGERWSKARLDHMLGGQWARVVVRLPELVVRVWRTGQ